MDEDFDAMKSEVSTKAEPEETVMSVIVT